MERRVKERLIGAAVLIAAAVILIPEMLSGPDPGEPDQPHVPAADSTPLKTYTIDLNRSPAGTAATPAEAPGEPTLAPEATRIQPEPLARGQATPDSVSGVSATAQPVTAPTAAAAAATQSAPSTPTGTTSRASTSSAGTATAVRENTSSVSGAAASSAGWAVQLGSFSSQATASDMVNQLRADGYEAFVMPVKSGAATLYRVRIGPLSDRQGAERIAGRIKPRIPAATVVKHP